MSNHDDHYKNFEKVLGHQPITVMEAVACNGLPQEFHAQAKQNLLVAMAIKYLLRLGHKDEADKEINKAENFLYRARTGSWRPAGVAPAPKPQGGTFEATVSEADRAAEVSAATRAVTLRYAEERRACAITGACYGCRATELTPPADIPCGNAAQFCEARIARR
jgi:hypothetical protein